MDLTYLCSCTESIWDFPSGHLPSPGCVWITCELSSSLVISLLLASHNRPACAVCFRLCFDNMTYYFTIYLCLCWVLIAARGLPLVVVSEDSSPAVVVRLVVEPGLQACGLQSLQYGGLAAPWHVESSQDRDQSCVRWLAGKLLTTGPPGKFSMICFRYWRWL